MTLTSNGHRTKGGADQGLGLRSTLGQVTQKRPRRLGQWAATVLFVLIVVIALVSLFRSQGDRVEVLQVTGSVPAGQVVEANDIRSVEVAGVDGAIKASDIDSVIGKRAANGLVEGQILTDAALSDQALPADGERLVALRLDQGRVPGDLGPGDVVNVLAVPPEGDPGSADNLDAPNVLAKATTVQSIGDTPEGALVVTVLIGEVEADSVAAHSAAGQITIVQAPDSDAQASGADDPQNSEGE